MLNTHHKPYDPRKFPGLTIEDPSMTVPDQTLKLRDIIDRFTRGLPIPGNMTEPVYAPDRDTFDFEHADFAEREAYIGQVREQEAFLRDRYKAAQIAENKAKKEAEDKRRRTEDKASILAEIKAEKEQLSTNSLG